jgi:hypothetical protein
MFSEYPRFKTILDNFNKDKLKMKKLLIALMLQPLVANADVYKCNKNGNIVFSDKACEYNAKKIKIKPANSFYDTTYTHRFPGREQAINSIKLRAAERHPGDYSTQLYVIKKNIDAYNQIVSFREKLNDNTVGIQISDRVLKRHPNDYSTQLYVINKQLDDYSLIN